MNLPEGNLNCRFRIYSTDKALTHRSLRPWTPCDYFISRKGKAIGEKGAQFIHNLSIIVGHRFCLQLAPLHANPLPSTMKIWYRYLEGRTPWLSKYMMVRVFENIALCCSCSYLARKAFGGTESASQNLICSFSVHRLWFFAHFAVIAHIVASRYVESS